jgi:hypothetical protein
VTSHLIRFYQSAEEPLSPTKYMDREKQLVAITMRYWEWLPGMLDEPTQ